MKKVSFNQVFDNQIIKRQKQLNYPEMSKNDREHNVYILEICIYYWSLGYGYNGPVVGPTESYGKRILMNRLGFQTP